MGKKYKVYFYKKNKSKYLVDFLKVVHLVFWSGVVLSPDMTSFVASDLTPMYGMTPA